MNCPKNREFARKLRVLSSLLQDYFWMYYILWFLTLQSTLNTDTHAFFAGIDTIFIFLCGCFTLAINALFTQFDFFGKPFAKNALTALLAVILAWCFTLAWHFEIFTFIAIWAAIYLWYPVNRINDVVCYISYWPWKVLLKSVHKLQYIGLLM